MLFSSLIVALFVCLAAAWPRVEEKVPEILRRMNLTEKMSLLSGINGPYTGNTPSIERLGIPALKMQDGPQGFRANDDTGGAGSTTAWPSALTIAASWDVDLLNRWAVAMSEEFAAKGANMALAPGIGIARVPVAGRNFEYLCGEDPVLGSKLVKPVVHGLQDNGILANAKHFINNEIEIKRMTVSADVDERTRFEIYYPPFQAAADAGVLTVMCSYNRINDVYACENEETIGHLRDVMGFQGFIVSDWTATKSTVRSLKAGMDQEMPVGIFYSDAALKVKLAAREISEADIDRSVGRILYAMDRIGLFERKPTGDPLANVTSDAHNALAREIAAQSTVLLKNTDNILPLQADRLGDCIAVIGDQTTVSGDGSGHVDAPYVITPVEGITKALAARGIVNTRVEYNSGEDLTAAGALAQQCTFAIVNVATISGEGNDRETLSLSNNQDALVAAVAAANPRTVVAMNIPGAILMPWIDDVAAALVLWMPGQEAGNALADILFGSVNPSARLPVTMPNKDNEVGFTKEQYPGTGKPMPDAQYVESLLIGYRWYDANNVKPVFPFGHGLSYTTFGYSSLQVHVLVHQNAPLKQALGDARPTMPLVVTQFVLENTGKIDGAEVVQLYLQYPDAAGEPPKQLRNFQKVYLSAGKQEGVVLALTKRDCAIWDIDTHSWQVVSGTYTVYVGASSRDLRLQQTFVL